MDNFFIYIIQSEYGHYYIGQTKNIEERLQRHNSNRSKSTKNKGKWKVVITKGFETRSEAMRMEQKLKNMKNCKKAIDYIEKLN